MQSSRDSRCFSIRRRKIYVLNLINKESRQPDNLKVDYSNCLNLDDPSIQYKIHYFELKLKDHKDTGEIDSLPYVYEEHISDLNDECNAMLIFGARIFPALLRSVLRFFKDFQIHKTLYILEPRLPEDEQNVLAKKLAIDYQLQKVEINPIDEMMQYREFLRNESRLPQNQGQETRNRLTCQPWFRYFLSTVFSCGKGRLLQVSGTCYLNAVLNCILLSTYFKFVAVNAMNTFALANPHLIKDIKFPIDKDVDVCPLPSEKLKVQRLIFIFRVMYNILCQGPTPKTLTKTAVPLDLFLKSSEKLFSGSISHHIRPSKAKLTAEGGSDLWVMYNFLVESKISFSLCFDDVHFFAPKPLSAQELQEFRKSDFILEQIQFSKEDPKDKDVILYSRRRFRGRGRLYIPEIDNFKPECALIVIYFEGGGSTHVVTGFVCDNVYKIYDPQNVIFDVDWRFLEYSEDHLKAQMQTRYLRRVVTVALDCVLFINRNHQMKFYRDGQCAF